MFFLLYLAAEDRLYGCGYNINGRAAPVASVMIFWVRSIYTSFNILLNTHSILGGVGSRSGVRKILEEQMSLIEAIGLELKAVICDRSGFNRLTLRGFRNGIYMQRKEGGCPYKVRQIFDYPHLIKAHYTKMTRDERYNYHLTSQLVTERNELSKFWVQRGATPSHVKPTNIPDFIAFFCNANSAYVRAAIKAQRVSDEKAIITSQCIDAITKLANVFHRDELNVSNWQEKKELPQSAGEFVQQEYPTELIATESMSTIEQFAALIEELLETYPEVPIKGYRVSQDLIERFICNAATRFQKRSRSAWDVNQLSRRLMRVQAEYYRNRPTNEHDYRLTELLDYRTPKPAKEALDLRF